MFFIFAENYLGKYQKTFYLYAVTKNCVYGQIDAFDVLYPLRVSRRCNGKRRHIHVVRRGSKKSHRGNTVAKIWIEENGQKKIEVAWSELNADEETEILKAIDEHWEELNQLIDDVFAGKKIQIKRIK